MVAKNDETATIGAGLVGVGAGTVQVYALRNYADTPGKPALEAMGDWGQPSAVVDLLLGTIATFAGGLMYRQGRKTPAAVGIGYGLTSLAGGLYSGFKPVGAEVTMTPQRLPAAPSQPQQQAPQRVAEQQAGLTIVPVRRTVGPTPDIVIRSLQT